MTSLSHILPDLSASLVARRSCDAKTQSALHRLELAAARQEGFKEGLLHAEAACEELRQNLQQNYAAQKISDRQQWVVEESESLARVIHEVIEKNLQQSHYAITTLLQPFIKNSIAEAAVRELHHVITQALPKDLTQAVVLRGQPDFIASLAEKLHQHGIDVTLEAQETAEITAEAGGYKITTAITSWLKSVENRA